MQGADIVGRGIILLTSHLLNMSLDSCTYTKKSRTAQVSVAIGPPFNRYYCKAKFFVVSRIPSYVLLATSPRLIRRGPTGGPPLFGRISCTKSQY